MPRGISANMVLGGLQQGVRKETRGRTNAAIHFADRETEDQQKELYDQIASLGRSKHLQSH